MQMKVVTKAKKMQHISTGLRGKGKSIGFVPTMGALHKGHLSLIQKSAKECDETIVSIYVNPTQFSPSEDFRGYPRPFSKDKLLCIREGVSFLFHPSHKEMYPAGFDTTVALGKLACVLEGKSRPAHFSGVTTVCAKLFNIVQPDAAFFGQKDFQQFLIIKQMARDLNMPLQIKMCPIVREKDSLAMSSRNAYLNAGERKNALALYSSLKAGKALIASGEKDASGVKRAMRSEFKKFPLAKIDYLAVADPETLAPLKRVEGKALLAAAAFLGKTRLIDNILVNAK